jgi:hypothetical protein
LHRAQTDVLSMLHLLQPVEHLHRNFFAHVLAAQTVLDALKAKMDVCTFGGAICSGVVITRQ